MIRLLNDRGPLLPLGCSSARPLQLLPQGKCALGQIWSQSRGRGILESHLTKDEIQETKMSSGSPLKFKVLSETCKLHRPGLCHLLAHILCLQPLAHSLPLNCLPAAASL